MRNSIILIASFFIILLVGSVYAVERDPDDTLPSMDGLPTILDGGCVNNYKGCSDLMEIGTAKGEKSYSWWSNCKCINNRAISDMSVCKFHHKDFTELPYGGDSYFLFNAQANREACRPCTGTYVPVTTKTVLPRTGGGALIYTKCDVQGYLPPELDPRDPWHDYYYGNYWSSMFYSGGDDNFYQCQYMVEIGPNCNPFIDDPTRQDCKEVPIIGFSQFFDRRSPNNLQKILSVFTQPCNPTASCPIQTSCPGDINNDGRVDNSDLAILSEYWKRGDCSNPNMCCGGADIAKCPGETGDTGRVDACDLAALAANLGKDCKAKSQEDIRRGMPIRAWF